MKKVIPLVILFSFFFVDSWVQPIQWKFSSTKQANGQYLLSVLGKIGPEWHIYSKISPSDGPTPTKVTFNSNPLIKLLGGIHENGKKIKHYEEVFDFDVFYFEDSVEYTQLVSLNTKQKIKTNITGTVEYMLCTNGKCLSPTKEKFSIELQ